MNAITTHSARPADSTGSTAVQAGLSRLSSDAEANSTSF